MKGSTRLTVNVRLDEAERFDAATETGPIKVRTLSLYFDLPYAGDLDILDVRIAGDAIKKDGTLGVIDRSTNTKVRDLPEGVRNDLIVLMLNNAMGR